MIHGGLQLTFKKDIPEAGHCCLRGPFFKIDPTTDFWNNSNFESLREINLSGKWDSGCNNCQRLENVGEISMRQGMNHGLGIVGKTQLLGPARIDLMFDISCNLACRTCGPHSSTFWKKQLGIPTVVTRSATDVISALSNLDLTNLQQLVFCGGETLLGQEYWKVADWLSDNVPNAKQQLTVCFQTNGTQSILPQNYKIIEKMHLVKLHISIDGTKERFEYLRWPANWRETTENILKIRQESPSNIMFVIEETVSIFNALYPTEVEQWVQSNFLTNKEGDIVNHTKHLATGQYSLDNISQEYYDKLLMSCSKDLIPHNWQENSVNITKMLYEIQQVDQQRNQSFAKTFPEVAECYQRFI
jgi:sulfatase maturation enzyme AslB (radical SAM superfamily)